MYPSKGSDVKDWVVGHGASKQVVELVANQASHCDYTTRKMKQDLRRLIDNWQLEFDMDDYHIIGAITVLLLGIGFGVTQETRSMKTMTRTMYENEDDRNNEQAIMELAAWNIEYRKLPMSYRMDFAVTKADAIVGFAEVKMRRMNWGHCQQSCCQ